MRWISFFRAVIDFVYFFAFLNALAAPFTIWIASQDSSRTINLGGQQVSNVHASFYAVAATSILGYTLFVRMLYFMKRATRELNPRDLFKKSVARYIIKAGQSCILAALFTKVPPFFYSLWLMFAHKDVSPARFGFSMGFSFESLFVILAFGFFLMLCGIIMQEGLRLKTENDLTI